MTDIVERLRQRPEYETILDHLGRDYGLNKSLEHKAADEIERLRDTLMRIGMPGHEIVYCRDGHEEAVLHARAALKESSHD